MDMKKTTNKDNSQFPAIVLISVVLMFVFLIALMYFQIVCDVTFRRIFKAAASVMFILTAVFSYKYSGKNKRTFIIMLIGFIFAFLGDVFLSFGSSGIFFILCRFFLHLSTILRLSYRFIQNRTIRSTERVKLFMT